MKKRFLIILTVLCICSFCVCLLWLPNENLSAEADTLSEVSYIDFDENGKQLTTLGSCSNYTEIADSNDTIRLGEFGTTTWYVVPKNASLLINGSMLIKGDVHLILCDGANLTIIDSILFSQAGPLNSRSLTIYSQSVGSAEGSLTVCAGFEIMQSSCTINGGNILIKQIDVRNEAHKNEYGINLNIEGNLTVNGGTVRVCGPNFAQNDESLSFGIHSYESTLTVNGGSLSVEGGNVVSDESATMARYASYGIHAESLTLTVNGGSLTATGGNVDSPVRNANSYGLYIEQNRGKIAINGGNAEICGGDVVTAAQAYSYGIYTAVDIEISNVGVLNATGGKAESSGDNPPESYGIYTETNVKVSDNGNLIAKSGEVYGSTRQRAKSFGLYSKGNIEVCDSGCLTGEGNSIYGSGFSSCGQSGGIYLIDEKELTISESGSVVGKGGNIESSLYSVYSYGIVINNSTLCIDGGSVIGEGGSVKSDLLMGSAFSYGIFICQDGNFIVNGGVVKAAGKKTEAVEINESIGINLPWGTLRIEDGIIEAYGGDANCVSGTLSSGMFINDTLIVNGGTITAKGGTSTAMISDRNIPCSVNCSGIYAAYATICGGTLTCVGGDAKDETNNGMSLGAQSVGFAAYELSIKGGTINAVSGKAIATSATSTAYSYGVRVSSNMTIEDGYITGVGGTAISLKSSESCDIYVDGKLSILGGSLTLTKDCLFNGGISVEADQKDLKSFIAAGCCYKISDDSLISGNDVTELNGIVCVMECPHSSCSDADCAHKAVCDLCGEECGEVNTVHTSLKHVEAKEATTEAEGNIEYWYCANCNKYFGSEDGKNEINLADTVMAKLEKSYTDPLPSQTNNNNHTVLWCALAFSGVGILIVVVVYLKKRKHFIK